jgi:hypothetical protein
MPTKSKVPADPYANKSIVAALTTIVGVAIQWLSTGAFTLAAEGTTALTGAVVTVLVYVVTNRRKLFSR